MNAMAQFNQSLAAGFEKILALPIRLHKLVVLPGRNLSLKDNTRYGSSTTQRTMQVFAIAFSLVDCFFGSVLSGSGLRY